MKLTRAYSAQQKETMGNIIERADILALQETGSNLHQNRAFKDIIEKMPNRKVEAIDQFAFVYNSEQFSIVDSCETIRPIRSVKCSFQVSLYIERDDDRDDFAFEIF